MHCLFYHLLDQSLIPSLTGFGLEEGDYPSIKHDIDPQFVGIIMKVDAEPGAVKVGLGDNGGVIRDFQRRFLGSFFKNGHILAIFPKNEPKKDI
jgi:hypothetical protein